MIYNFLEDLQVFVVHFHRPRILFDYFLNVTEIWLSCFSEHGSDDQELNYQLRLKQCDGTFSFGRVIVLEAVGGRWNGQHLTGMR